MATSIGCLIYRFIEFTCFNLGLFAILRMLISNAGVQLFYLRS